MTNSATNTFEFTTITLGPFKVLLLIIVGVWIVTMWLTAMKNHQHSTKTAQKLCPGCSTPNPGHAGFCRNCGKKL